MLTRRCSFLVSTLISLTVANATIAHTHNNNEDLAMRLLLFKQQGTEYSAAYNDYLLIPQTNFCTFADKKITFQDIIGGVPSEIKDLKEFISDSQYYKDAGAIMPKGYLFYGPPGTGKTLLARAVAGEVNAAFFSLSGSSFTSKYAGEGVELVNEAFEEAEEAIDSGEFDKAIIFIDELDSIGKRSSEDSGVSKDNNRTINALLVKMDGINSNKNIIVIGATNNPDLIDEALKRAGRFEFHIEIKLPDMQKREALLRHYASSHYNRTTANDVDFTLLSKETKGFNCADIASLVNRAAIYVARQKQRIITKEAFMVALEQIKAAKLSPEMPD